MSEKSKQIPEKAWWFRRFDAKRTYPYILPPDRHRWIQFGLTSDKHYTSKFCDSDSIRQFYRDLNNLGITHIFDAGDIWEGCTGYTQVYRGQIHDVDQIGFDIGLATTSHEHPKYRNITTPFILGNHGARVLEREGMDFGKHLSILRPDLQYLQPYYARVLLSEDPQLTLDLIHLAGGVPYTIGYAIQKYIRNVPPSQRANLYGFGHTHHHQHVSAEGDDECWLTGGWQDPSEYNIRRGAGVMKGGYRVRVKLSDNSPDPIQRVESTFLRYG